jgi:hypothetical protein
LIKEELFKDPFVGEFLAGFARILLFVEAVIRTSLASQPILTMFDLEMSVLCHPFFAKKNGLRMLPWGSCKTILW